MKKHICVVGIFLLAGTLVFTSCDTFFSSSWGTEREYDPANITINNSADAKKWLAEAAGRPKLAAAVGEKIKQVLSNVNQGHPTLDQIKMIEAGVEAAIEQAELGQILLSNAGGAVGKLMNSNNIGEDFKGLVSDIVTDLKSGSISQAAGNLAGIAGKAMTSASFANGETPEFSNEFKQSASASNVGEAVMVLAIDLFPQSIVDQLKTDPENVVFSDFDEYNAGLTFNNGKVEVDGTAGQKAQVLAAYLNMIADDAGDKFDKNPITSALKSQFLGHA
jgi:hypothetical protein